MQAGLRWTAAIVGLLATVGGWTLTSPGDAQGIVLGHGIVVYVTRPSELAMARWAVGRFEQAGLGLPPVQIHFHDELSGCRGYPGFIRGGRIDLCPGRELTLVSRHDILHELAHAWTELHLSPAAKKRFMTLRDLPTWNSSSAPWDRRGFEQVAEVVAWGVGQGLPMPRVADPDPADMAWTFRELTDHPPIAPLDPPPFPW